MLVAGDDPYAYKGLRDISTPHVAAGQGRRLRPLTGYALVGVSTGEARPDLWAHPGVAVGDDGVLWVGSVTGCALARIDPDGEHRTIPLPTTECHGIAADVDGSLWVADNGHKRSLSGGRLVDRDAPGQVLHVVDGEVVGELSAPAGVDWHPTGVAVDGGRVFVADGYGSGTVFAFDRDGTPLWSTTGTDSGTTFSTPHGIALDRRKRSAGVIVADRRNHRLVILEPADGTVISVLGDTALTSPSGVVTDDELIWVTELYGAVVALDRNGDIVERLGAVRTERLAGWPNRLLGGVAQPPEPPSDGFVSPHGIGILRTGELVVTEWFLGGRTTIATPVRVPA